MTRFARSLAHPISYRSVIWARKVPPYSISKRLLENRVVKAISETLINSTTFSPAELSLHIKPTQVMHSFAVSLQFQPHLHFLCKKQLYRNREILFHSFVVFKYFKILNIDSKKYFLEWNWNSGRRYNLIFSFVIIG